MTDYATLTDAEINRRIARALGYTVRRIESSRQMSLREGLHEYLLIDPHGFSVYGAEEGAIRSEEGAWGHLPRWSNDAGAALFLIEGLTYKIAHALWSDEVKYWVSIDDDDYRQDKGQAMTLPRAICEAWLAWKEATHD